MSKMQTKKETVLRKTPTASTKILDIIPEGENVSVIETLNTWSKVDYNDQEGWVPSSELFAPGSVSKAKIEESTELPESYESEESPETDNDPSEMINDIPEKKSKKKQSNDSK